MHEASGGIELVVGMTEPELGQEPAGRVVLRVVAREQPPGSKALEGVLDYRAAGLMGEAGTPVARADVSTQLKTARRYVMRPQPAAAHVLMRGEQEDRPILDAVLLAERYLCSKAFGNLSLGQRPPAVDQPRDEWIAPESEREVEVLRFPDSKTKPFTPEEVVATGHAPQISLAKRM